MVIPSMYLFLSLPGKQEVQKPGDHFLAGQIQIGLKTPGVAEARTCLRPEDRAPAYRAGQES